MNILEWKSIGKYFKYKNNHKIFYILNDIQRPFVLLLHGFPTSSWDYHKIYSTLSKEYNIIAPDFIGYGYSDKPTKYSYSIVDQANMVEQLLAFLEINEVDILAHNFGDSIAQELIARQKAEANKIQITSVCLLNGGMIQEGNHPRPIQNLLATSLGKFLTPFLSKALLKRTFDKIFGPNTKATDQEINSFYELILFNNGKKVIPKLIRYLHERKTMNDRWKDALVNCPIPLLLINGLKDPVSGERLIRSIQNLNPTINITELHNIGHYPQTEDPESVLKHYLRFRSK